MEESFIRNRISELRIKKGVSEYKMSLNLGFSKSYIQIISSGKALPSLTEFLYICEYLGVTPSDFCDSNVTEPQLLHQLSQITPFLSFEDMQLLISIALRLANRSSKD